MIYSSVGLRFAIKIDHDLVISKITDYGLDLISLVIMPKESLLIQMLSFFRIDRIHVLQINCIHVHKTEQYENSVSSILVDAKTIDNEHHYHNYDVQK